MSITLIQQPAEIVFSRNPIWFGFQTDNLYNPAGQASVYTLAFPDGPLADGAVFDIIYGGSLISQTFTVKNYPDDSGLQIKAGVDVPLEGDLDELQWCTQLAEFFSYNYLISRDYVATVDTSGLNPKVKLTAKVFDPYFNITVSDQLFVTSAQLTNGIKTVRNTNFKLYYEIWIENEAHTGFYKLMSDIFADVSDTGISNINISKAITEALRGAQNDFDTPDAALPTAFHAKKTCRRYYMRYAEVYGEVQKVRKLQNTATKWALLGGVGKFKLTDYSVATNFLDTGIHKFLKIEPVSKSVKLTQPEWLSIIWLSTVPANIRLHVKVYYSTGDPEDVTMYPFAGLLKYDKITFPTGCTQLDLPAVDEARIITKYEVWVENSADSAVLSEVRTYILDYTQNLAKYIIELSSFGVYDTFQCYGKGASTYDLTTDKAVISRSAAFNFSDGETIDFDNSLEQKETIRTGWQSRREISRYRDLFLSWDKFLVRNGRMYPISTNTKSIKEFDDDVNLYALEFEIGFRYTEELYSEEDDPDQAIDLAQYIPIISNPTPDNYDTYYYRKSQTYNKAEVDDFIASTLATEQAHHDAQALLIADIESSMAGKADADHNHDLLYVSQTDFNEFATAVGVAMMYKGTFNPAYTLDPLDAEIFPGYSIDDRVEFAGQLWKSLEDENTVVPGTNIAKWVNILDTKTIISLTEPVTLNWQAGVIPTKDYTWAQKYGNELPGIAGAWWYNGSTWELFQGVQLNPAYDGVTLLSIGLSADLYPVQIKII